MGIFLHSQLAASESSLIPPMGSQLLDPDKSSSAQTEFSFLWILSAVGNGKTTPSSHSSLLLTFLAKSEANAEEDTHLPPSSCNSSLIRGNSIWENSRVSVSCLISHSNGHAMGAYRPIPYAPPLETAMYPGVPQLFRGHACVNQCCRLERDLSHVFSFE